MNEPNPNTALLFELKICALLEIPYKHFMNTQSALFEDPLHALSQLLLRYLHIRPPGMHAMSRYMLCHLCLAIKRLKQSVATALGEKTWRV